MTAILRSRPARSTQPIYRADIDGLRGISVLAVIGFHAFPRYFKGGFVGVDVFFVISGFLISSIIFAEIEQDRFSFRRFYARRISRIFPSLSLVLLVCFVAGWCVLFAREYQQLGTHIIAGAGFFSNFLLFSEIGYFDTAAHTKPLLHLWSLGVEEQFYLVWPAVIFLTWRLQFNLLSITLSVFVVSFALNATSLFYDAAFAFYSPLTRFWELMSGSILAYAIWFRRDVVSELKKRVDSVFHLQLPWIAPIPDSPTASNAIGWAGIALIAISVFADNHDLPGWQVAFAIVGASLLISSQAGWVNRTALSRRGLVWIGLISYPLYLWHWPLLSFASIVRGSPPSALMSAGLVASSIVLAWLTYRLAEKPIRFGAHRAAKAVVLCVLLVMTGSAGYAVYAASGFPERPVALANKSIEADLMLPERNKRSDSSCRELLGIIPDEGEVCIANTGNPEIMMVGDSLAIAFNSAVPAGLVSANTVLLSAPRSLNCFDRWLSTQTVCSHILDQALLLASTKPTIVAVVFVFSGGDSIFVDASKQLIVQEKFHGFNKAIVYARPVTSVFPCPRARLGL